MQRTIILFRKDDEAHWVAMLSCHHPQHVRHDPPLMSRPWVLTAEGRTSRLGEQLVCKRCEEAEWPECVQPYRQTRHFTCETTPAGLRADHHTREGVWAKINVVRGELDYVVGERVQRLVEGGEPGIIVPAQLHHVTPLEGVEFFVEFYRVSQA